MMPPGIRPGQLPPFHLLGEYTFQDLCRDLLSMQPGIGTCEVYGVRGESQDGIDLLARREQGDAIEVAQCKCYEQFRPRDIRAASDEFFAHWGRWSQENVKRFILFVAGDVSHRQRQDEISRQRQRFAELGITYEVWSASALRNKLRPHQAIVATYCEPSEYWIQVICGAASPITSSATSAGARITALVSDTLASQLTRLSERVTSDTERTLEAMRSAAREGRAIEAVRWIGELKSDSAVWPVLPAAVKSRVLRFEAGLLLDSQRDVERAKALASEARALASSEPQDTRLRAVIAYVEQGPEEGLKYLVDPLDVDGMNLRAALLLEAGRSEEAEVALSDREGFIPNAETYRLRAVRHLLARDLERARISILKALELEPTWESNRVIGARIDYFSALAPPALPLHPLVAWPEPVDWALVRRDDDALTHLRHAAEVFRETAQAVEGQVRERRDLEAWHLACLANDPDRQDAAIAFCQTMLRSDPVHYQAIAWCVSRNFGLDLAPSEKALRKLVKAEHAEVPHLLALVSCYLAGRRAAAAIKLLKDTKATFEKAGAQVLHLFWLVQALVLADQPRKALAVLDASGSAQELREARILALRAAASSDREHEQLVTYLEQSYVETGDPRLLFQACQAYAERGKWSPVAEQAETLVSQLATPEALRLAALGLYNVRAFDRCVALLDANAGIFRDGRLPTQLRRARALAQQARGVLPDAVAEAEALVRDAPTTENLLTLAHIYFSKGDLKGLAITARRLGGRTDLAVESALQLARIVQLEDRPLAETLWRQSIEQGVPDDAVGPAVTLGYQLGLDREVTPLLSRLKRLGHQDRGGIQLGSIEKFISFIEERRQQGAKVEELYRNGTAPIHAIAHALNRPLVDFYHRLPGANEAAPSPQEQFILLARHGGRALPDAFEQQTPTWRLHLDTTALLLAAHLEILDPVESAFKPLRIPQELVLALLQMREQLEHHQPSRLQRCRDIVDLVEAGRLRVLQPTNPLNADLQAWAEELGEDWVAAVQAMSESQGYLVDFLPLRKRDGAPLLLSHLPSMAAQHVCNSLAITDLLREDGALSESEYARALDALGEEGRTAPSEARPKVAAPLHLHAILPEVFAEANLLSIACQRFIVTLDQQELDDARNTLKEHDRRRDAAGWLDRIINRVRVGLDAGNYQIIATAYGDAGLDDAKDPAPEMSALRLLLSFERRESDVIWVDDRCISSYAHANGAPIVGVLEVMRSLVSAGQLSVSQYFERLFRLRAGNVRFIPVHKTEILHHLAEAPVEAGTVKETRGLAILRRSVAASLLQGTVLQRPPMPSGSPNENGELEYIVGLGRAIIDALVGAWKNHADDLQMAKAKSEWILRNLYLDHLSLFAVPALRELGAEEQRYILATSLVALLTQAVVLPDDGTPSDSPSSRRQYCEWVFERVLEQRLEAEPWLLAAVAESLKKSILSTIDAAQAGSARAVARGVFRDFYRDLPEPVRNELWQDADFMASIGIRGAIRVTIGDWAFDPDAYWRAAAEAVNDRQAEIATADQGEPVIFKPHPRDGDRVVIGLCRPGKDPILVADDEFAVLLDSPEDRESALLRHKAWFDLPQQLLKQTVVEIAVIESPWKRAEAVRSWRRSSVAEHYRNLQEQFGKREGFRFNALLPGDGSALLRHLRLPEDIGDGDAFLEGLTTAASVLLEEEGLQETLDRLVGLPVPLPAVVVRAATSVGADEFARLTRHLLQSARSPVCMPHLIHLLLRASTSSPTCARLARRLVKRLLSEESKREFKAFHALLRWVDAEVSRWASARAWSASVRLTALWLNTHRLFAAFRSAGAPSEWVNETFRARVPAVTLEIFERDTKYWQDVAHPSKTAWPSFVLTGLAYAIEQDADRAVDSRVRDQAIAVCTLEFEGGRLPSVALLRDSSLMGNQLGSFLGRGYGEAALYILPPEQASELTSPNLRKLADIAVARLRGDRLDSASWLRLYAVLGDLPPHESLRAELKLVLESADFPALWARDRIGGAVALQTAALQLKHLNDADLRGKLENQLNKVAALLANAKDAGLKSSDDEATEKVMMLEAALNLAIAGAPQEDVISSFMRLIQSIARNWPSMIVLCRRIVQHLYDELPSPYAQRVASGLAWLRSKP